ILSDRINSSTAAAPSPARSSSEDAVHDPEDFPVPLLSNISAAQPFFAKRSASEARLSRVCGPEPWSSASAGNGPSPFGVRSEPERLTEPLTNLTSCLENRSPESWPAGGACAESPVAAPHEIVKKRRRRAVVAVRMKRASQPR